MLTVVTSYHPREILSTTCVEVAGDEIVTFLLLAFVTRLWHSQYWYSLLGEREL